jgi:hypothetical protein
MDASAIRQKLLIEQKRQRLKQMQAQQMSAMPQDEVTDEMPSWLADTDRLKAKNLTNNVGEQVAFLQKQYPDAEVKSQGDKVLLRKQGEQAYGVLDPSFSVGKMFSAEGLRDAGDIVGDIGQGVAEGAGAAFGAAGGLPGVMAGSAGGSLVASTAKQKLAQALGVKDNFDYGNVAMDTALGGLIPGGLAVAGTGAKVAAKKVAPWLYSKATGLSTDALKAIGSGAGDMSDIETLDLIKGIGERIRGSVDSRRAGLKDEFVQFRGTNAQVDTTSARARLKAAIKEAREKAERSGSRLLDEEAAALGGMDKKIFAKTGAPAQTVRLDYDPLTFELNKVAEEVPNFIDPKQKLSDALDMKQAIKNKYMDYTDDIGGKMGTGNTVSAQEQRAASDVLKSLDQEIFGVSPDGKALNSKYKDAIDDVDYLNSRFRTDDKIQNTLRNLRKGRDRVLKGNVEKLDQGTKNSINQANKKLEIHEFFNNPEEGNYIRKGTDTILGKTPLSKALSAAGAFTGYVTGGGYAGSAIGAGAGRVAGDLLTSPEAVKRITKGAKNMGIEMDNLEALIQQNPELLRILYGAGAAATQD